jgi:hypothetical protein
MLPNIATRMTGTHHAQLLVEMGLMNFFLRMAFNCDPPELNLPSSWDYRCEPRVPDFALGFKDAKVRSQG